MSAIAADLSPAERAERRKFLRSLGLGRPKGDIVEPGSEGLHAGGPRPPTHGERHARETIASSVAMLSEEALAAPLTWRGGFEGILETALCGVFDGDDAVYECVVKLREQVAEIKDTQRTELAELKLALTEARCEIREMKAIQEAARVASRGERGEQGVRGIPGPPGAEGKTGPKGPKGETGPAAKIAAWEPNIEAYSIAPIYVDGKRGVSASLRPFFEQYDASTRGDEDEA